MSGLQRHRRARVRIRDGGVEHRLGGLQQRAEQFVASGQRGQRGRHLGQRGRGAEGVQHPEQRVGEFDEVPVAGPVGAQRRDGGRHIAVEDAPLPVAEGDTGQHGMLAVAHRAVTERGVVEAELDGHRVHPAVLEGAAFDQDTGRVAVGPHASPGFGALLHHGDAAAGPGQPQRGDQPVVPTTDDEHIGHPGAHPVTTEWPVATRPAFTPTRSASGRQRAIWVASSTVVHR